MFSKKSASYKSFDKYSCYIYDEDINNKKIILENLKKDFIEFKNYTKSFASFDSAKFELLNQSIENLIEQYADDMTSNKATFLYFCMSVMHDKSLGKDQSSMKLAYTMLTEEKLKIIEEKLTVGELADDVDWLSLFHMYHLSDYDAYLVDVNIKTFSELNLNFKYIPCVSSDGSIGHCDTVYLLTHENNLMPIGVATKKQSVAHYGVSNLRESKTCMIIHDINHGELINLEKSFRPEKYKYKKSIHDLVKYNQLNDEEMFFLFLYFHEVNDKRAVNIEDFLEAIYAMSPPAQTFFDESEIPNDHLREVILDDNYNSTGMSTDSIESFQYKLREDYLANSVDMKYALRKLGYNMPKLKRHEASLMRGCNFVMLGALTILVKALCNDDLTSKLNLDVNSENIGYIKKAIELYGDKISDPKYGFTEKLLEKWKVGVDKLNVHIAELENKFVHEQDNTSNLTHL